MGVRYFLYDGSPESTGFFDHPGSSVAAVCPGQGCSRSISPSLVRESLVHIVDDTATFVLRRRSHIESSEAKLGITLRVGMVVVGGEGVRRVGVHTTTSCAEIIIIFEKQMFSLFSTVYATCDHNIIFLKAIVQRFLINNYLEFKQRFKQGFRCLKCV